MRKKIAELREERGWTQAQLAEILGVSENTIANWEKGGAFDKWIKNLIKLCDTLGCQLQDLDPDFHVISWCNLTPRMYQPIKAYYEACLRKDKNKMSEIYAFTTQYDPELRYWLNKANEMREQFNDKNQEPISSTTLINHLILWNFSQHLTSESATSNQLQPFMTREKFEEALEKLKDLDLSDIAKHYKDIREDHYSRKLILRIGQLNIYAITWQYMHISRLHHHGYSLDAIKVIEGEMTHWLISPEEYQKKVGNQPIPYEGDEFKKYEGEEFQTFFKKDGWIVIDQRCGHQIKNLSENTLFTIHIRYGAPPEDEYWVYDDKNPSRIIN